MRTCTGSSVVELLIASALMSLVAVTFLSLLFSTYKANAKITNVTDTATAVRLVKERLGRDLREGRTLGDVYGTGYWDPFQGAPNAIWIPQGTDVFPGSLNPVYGNGQQPPFGWPTSWTGGGVNQPYQLSGTCLIVQVPIGDNHNDNNSQHSWDTTKFGWPTAIYPNSPQYNQAAYNGLGPGNPAVSTPWDNVETHVYQAVPDPENSGEWQLQWDSFPGYPVPGYNPRAHNLGSPEVLVKGIVGPFDQNGNLRLFQFIDKTDPTGTPQNSILPDAAHVANYTGVVVNLELREHTDSNVHRKDISLQPVGFKTEVFLRNNAIATTNGG